MPVFRMTCGFFACPPPPSFVGFFYQQVFSIFVRRKFDSEKMHVLAPIPPPETKLQFFVILDFFLANKFLESARSQSFH